MKLKSPTCAVFLTFCHFVEDDSRMNRENMAPGDPGCCYLCGLPLGDNGVTAGFKGYGFCCTGCRQVFSILMEAADSPDPVKFRETELFRECRAMGIIPGPGNDPAGSAGADPRMAALVVAVACSNTFILPTHQVNALIMRPGGYRTIDYFKAGSGMTILYLVVMMAAIATFYGISG